MPLSISGSTSNEVLAWYMSKAEVKPQNEDMTEMRGRRERQARERKEVTRTTNVDDKGLQ